VALGVYASGVLSGLPDAKTMIQDLAQALGKWTYALVAVMAFLETGAFVGLVAPGEFTVIVGGVVAGQGTIGIVPLIGLTWLACILGDTTSFFVGRRLGRQFLERHGPKVKITHERLEQVDGYFQRHGGKTILIGRFIGLVRALAPFVAGASGMRYSRFIPYSVIGTGLWSTAFLLLGFFFYRSFDQVAQIAGRATLVFACLVAIVVAAVWAYRRLRDDEERARFARWVDRQSSRPALRPLRAVAIGAWRAILRPVWRAVWPPVRFLWDRITPGELGLELTTALAVAGVGFYVFVGYLVVVSSNPAPTGLDNELFDFAQSVRTSAGVGIAKAITALGGTPVVLPITLVAGVLLAVRKRPIELVVLIAGTLLTVAIVQITKGAVGRARPPHPLAGAAGAAYPSGHAAHAMVYPVLAVIAARVLRGAVSRTALVLVGLLLAVAIGLSRVYLQVHWASDVLGGWGVGAAIFGLVGAIGLVVGYFRNNEPSPGVPAPGAPDQREAHEPVSSLGH
jgi:membrane protein DedA with SNARE-associated domain/membrane-associated phospholipid phosphatase